MTSTTLLSPHWYRIAYLRPRLKRGVRMARQRVRGHTWHVLSDAISGRHHRFDDQAYALVAACDGEATIDDIWARRVDALGDEAPTQAQAIEVFAMAFAANLLDGDVAADARATLRAERRRRVQRRRTALNPMSFKLPLWNPSRLLQAQMHRVAWLFHPASLLAIAALMLAGLVMMAWNATELSRHAATHLGQGRVLILLWIVYPLIKLVHELAHAFAVKHYGGDVQEMGVSMLMLTPVPYVDASAAVAFERKRERMIVGAAGIAAEGLIASAALVVWLLVEPGFVRDLALAVSVVAGVSTLAVNGNPLLKFDGYHVFCDALELPNLAQRSGQWWRGVFKHIVLGRATDSGETARGRERAWLVVYAPASWLARGALTVGLAFALAGWQPWVGLAVLLMAAWWMLGAPAWAALRWLAASADVQGARARAWATGGGLALAIVSLACLAPLPHHTTTPGVVWLPDEAIVRPTAEGFIEEILVRDGEQVAAGTLLLRLGNDTLRQALLRLGSELEQQRVEQLSLIDSDPLRAAQAADRLAALSVEHRRMLERVAGLELRAGVAGRVAMDHHKLVPGRWLQQGQIAAHVLPPGPARVRALVDHEDITRLRPSVPEPADGTAAREADLPLGVAGVTGETSVMGVMGAIEVRLASAGDTPQVAQWLRSVPRASTLLSTPALGAKAGGPLELDPADPEGRTTLEPHFEVELRLPEDAKAHIGERAWVRFDHGDATLVEISARFVRRTFLRHFAT